MRRRSFAALSATQVSSPQQPMLRLARALPISVSPVQRFDQFGQFLASKSIVGRHCFQAQVFHRKNVSLDFQPKLTRMVKVWQNDLPHLVSTRRCFSTTSSHAPLTFVDLRTRTHALAPHMCVWGKKFRCSDARPVPLWCDLPNRLSPFFQVSSWTGRELAYNRAIRRSFRWNLFKLSPFCSLASVNYFLEKRSSLAWDGLWMRRSAALSLVHDELLIFERTPDMDLFSLTYWAWGGLKRV